MGKKSKAKGRHHGRRPADDPGRQPASGTAWGPDGRWATMGVADHGSAARGIAAPRDARAHGSGRGPHTPSAELAADLVSATAQLQRLVGHGVDGDGLTRARLSALGVLVLGGPCTLGELAAREGVRPPTMTRLVRSMESAGLVARERHPTDGRSVILHATPDGEMILATGQAARLGSLAAAIERLDGRARRDLERGAVTLARLLRDVGRWRGGARRPHP